MVLSETAYIAFGCPDWGEKGGRRNGLCTFCAIPSAASQFRDAFYENGTMLTRDHASLFNATLSLLVGSTGCHTLMIFNAGSYLAMPSALQLLVMKEVITYTGISRVVIESRAPLVTKEALRPLMSILSSAGKRLTVRIGVETQDDHLRLKVLKKGHSRTQLLDAISVMRDLDVDCGGYALLNPAPGLDPKWAVREAVATLDWILSREEGLGMDEAYFGPTCVGSNTPLTEHWKAGEFFPASLRDVSAVLKETLPRYRGRIHLLPFADEPPFLAVPSNHVKRGLPETLVGALGCDLEFHRMFEEYRTTMNPEVLHEIMCTCS